MDRAETLGCLSYSWSSIEAAAARRRLRYQRVGMNLELEAVVTDSDSVEYKNEKELKSEIFTRVNR